MFNEQFIDNILNMYVQSKKNLTSLEQEYIDVIKRRDSSKGVEIATSLCNGMNMSKEDLSAQSANFFRNNYNMPF